MLSSGKQRTERLADNGQSSHPAPSEARHRGDPNSRGKRDRTRRVRFDAALSSDAIAFDATVHTFRRPLGPRAATSALAGGWAHHRPIFAGPKGSGCQRGTAGSIDVRYPNMDLGVHPVQIDMPLLDQANAAHRWLCTSRRSLARVDL